LPKIPNQKTATKQQLCRQICIIYHYASNKHSITPMTKQLCVSSMMLSIELVIVVVPSWQATNARKTTELCLWYNNSN